MSTSWTGIFLGKPLLDTVRVEVVSASTVELYRLQAFAPTPNAGRQGGCISHVFAFSDILGANGAEPIVDIFEASSWRVHTQAD